MPQTTTHRKIKHPLQSFVETTEGQFPVTGTGVAYPFATLELEVDGQYQDVGQCGPEELLTLVKNTEINTFRITAPINADIWDLIKWFTKPLNFDSPSGTAAESRSFLFSIRLNGIINYIKMLGVKPKSYSAKITGGRVDEVTFEFSCVDIADPTTSAPTGVTLATVFPSGAVYRGGQASLSFNGQSITFKELTLNVNRGTEGDEVAGQDIVYGNQVYMLDVAGSFTALWGVNSSPLTDYNADTEASLEITFAASKTITFNAKLTKRKNSLDNGSSVAAPEIWDFKFIDSMAVSN